MGNINGWAGPPTPTYRKMQMILQQKIIKKQRNFGMSVAIPSFAGHLPIALKRLFPNVNFSIIDRWNKFPNKYCCSLFLDPNDMLFKNIAERFLRKVIDNYGTDHIYFADPFNEIQPRIADPAYLNMTAYHIFDSMRNVDEHAVWMLQGWMFVKNIFWSDSLIKSFLTAVPNGRLLVLDLQSEQYPQYERTHSFYGQPFVWCMLHNFGGTLGMHGSVDVVNKRIRKAREMHNSSMIGVGITPEGINQNYVIYALALERAWLKDDINLTKWFNTYSDVRYGVEEPRLRNAWQLLKNSVYSYYGLRKLRGKYVLARRPSTRLNVWTWYNISYIHESWSKFIDANASISIGHYSDYENDLVDITRQFLQSTADYLYVNIMDAYKREQIDRFNKLSTKMMDIFKDLNAVLSTHKNFLLGVWLENAKKWATTSDEEGLFEFNARNQITLWGPSGQVLDYATKQWSGVVKDFFEPRWKLFLTELGNSLKNNQPFNNTVFIKRVFNEVEVPFNYQKTRYPTIPHGNAYNTAKHIYSLWTEFFTNEVSVNDLLLVNLKTIKF